jgi:hypothetical protein
MGEQGVSRYAKGIKDYRDEQRFLNEMEQGVRLANQEIIHERIPGLDKHTILALAVSVARLRASYLEAALKIGSLGSDEPDKALVGELRGRREAFEEARIAYEALHRAIEVGYIDVGQIDAGTSKSANDAK